MADTIVKIRRRRRAGRPDREATDNLLPRLRSSRMRELRKLGLIEADEVPDTIPENVMAELLSNTLGYMRWIREVVGTLKPEEFWLIDPRTHEKIAGAEFELEMRLVGVVKGLAESMIRFNLDERGVVVEETKIEIITTALREAARQAGLDEATQRALGVHLREQLQLIEGRATEMAA